jgi:hypothetical protein
MIDTPFFDVLRSLRDEERIFYSFLWGDSIFYSIGLLLFLSSKNHAKTEDMPAERAISLAKDGFFTLFIGHRR